MSDNLIARLEGLALSNGISLPLEAATALAEAQAEIARLREALRFYATLDGCANCLLAIYDDNFGDHARAALSPKPATPSA